MTEKAYQRDPYLRQLAGKIIRSENRDGRWAVRLESTIFCPEGGGQPADAGTINDLPLLALEIDGDEIVHVLDRDPGVGAARLQLDFTRRYDHMQQHTAQHLLSQVLVRDFNAATLSFAIGPELSSIEVGRAAFSEEEVRALEAECARLSFAALPVRVFETEDPSSLRLRKPPKVQGRIRVVEIEGFDQSACGGTHVRNSAELGLLKIVRRERVRSNVRLYYAAGCRALRDYQLKGEIVQRLQRLVTLPPAELPLQVEALLGERDELRRELKRWRRLEMDRQVAAAISETGSMVIREFSDGEPADLRYFASALMAAGKHVLACRRSDPPYVVIGRGSGDFDLRSVSARIFALLNGKGGGSAALLEGRANDLSRVNEAGELLRQSLQDPPGPRP